MTHQALLPHHIAIICDGNRRWARSQGLAVFKGHEHAVHRTLQPLVDHCLELGIKYLTFWVFSTENWDRDRLEIDALMRLFKEIFTNQADEMHRKKVRINTIGVLDRFDDEIQSKVAHWTEVTRQNTGVTVTFALNYGGRDELLRATKKIAAQVQAGALTPEQITPEVIAAQLDTHDLPDPDLIIRPGGEQRLSGFLTWQSVYSELYFSQVPFPDFSPVELDAALAEYARRQRRFGK